MTEWKARRFWSSAQVQALDNGWQVALDDKPVRTPGKKPLVLPTKALAEAIADEWDAQKEIINPNCMPLTRAANSAVEKVRPNFAAVAEMLAAYGGTDLLSYRAEQPVALTELQAAEWDPLIDWAATELDAPLRVTQGVMPITQDPAVLERLLTAVSQNDDFGLTALHDLVTLPGSLILGLAVINGRISGAEAHRLSEIDQEFQFDIWGRDELADAASAGRLAAIQTSEQLWQLSRRG